MSITKENKEGKLSEAKRLRQSGESYLGYRRENNKVSHSVDREERKMGLACK